MTAKNKKNGSKKKKIRNVVDLEGEGAGGAGGAGEVETGVGEGKGGGGGVTVCGDSPASLVLSRLRVEGSEAAATDGAAQVS